MPTFDLPTDPKLLQAVARLFIEVEDKERLIYGRRLWERILEQWRCAAMGHPDPPVQIASNILQLRFRTVIYSIRCMSGLADRLDGHSRDTSFPETMKPHAKTALVEVDRALGIGLKEFVDASTALWCSLPLEERIERLRTLRMRLDEPAQPAAEVCDVGTYPRSQATDYNLVLHLLKHRCSVDPEAASSIDLSSREYDFADGNHASLWMSARHESEDIAVV